MWKKYPTLLKGNTGYFFAPLLRQNGNELIFPLTCYFQLLCVCRSKYSSATSGSLNSPSRDSGKGNPLTCQGVGDGPYKPQLLFFFPLWLMCPSPRPHRKTSVSVRLPSPAGRGGDFCSLRSRRDIEFSLFYI